MNGDISSNYPIIAISVSFNNTSPLRALMKTIPDRCPVVVLNLAGEVDSI